MRNSKELSHILYDLNLASHLFGVLVSGKLWEFSEIKSFLALDFTNDIEKTAV